MDFLLKFALSLLSKVTSKLMKLKKKKDVLEQTKCIRKQTCLLK